MIDHFSKAQFEDALPAGRWESLGIQYDEYCYIISVMPGVRIYIRSSVNMSGFSDDRGENSIRTWLQDDKGNFIGSKLKRWITRQPGWQDRLLDHLRAMWRIGRHLGTCKCGGKLMAFRAKTGKHSGWIFRKCDKCGQMDWLGDFGV